MHLCPHLADPEKCASKLCQITHKCPEPVKAPSPWFPCPVRQMTQEQLHAAMRVLARDLAKEARVIAIKRKAYSDSMERDS